MILKREEMSKDLEGGEKNKSSQVILIAQNFIMTKSKVTILDSTQQ